MHHLVGVTGSDIWRPKCKVRGNVPGNVLCVAWVGPSAGLGYGLFGQL